MTTVNANAEEPVHVQLMQWAKKNPEMAAVCGIYIAWELSPIGPTKMMWNIAVDMKAKTAAEEAKWQRIELTVPPQFREGDIMTVPNPNFPGQKFECAIPKGKAAGDKFKAKLPC